MEKKGHARTTRWSVALSHQLIEEVKAAAPPELRENLNRLIAVAIQEFVAKRKERAFEEAMAQMAADPAVQAECAAISRKFAVTEADRPGPFL